MKSTISVRRRWLLLLMWRMIVLVLMLVVVVLMILRIAIGQGISGVSCCQMICHRVAIVQRPSIPASTWMATRRNHHLLIIAGEVPLQVLLLLLLRRLLLWVQLLIESAIVKMGIATVQGRGLGGRSRR